MKNAFVRYSSTCACMLMAGALTISMASAASRDIASVTLPQAVTVGSTTLPSGHYTIASEGSDAFLIQSDNGHQSAVILGRRVDEDKNAPKSEVVLSGEGNSLHLDKLYIAGDSTAYEFER